MHPSYYYRAHCCVLVFDVTRKITYQHLSDWYSELREYCSDIPCVLVANKIDVDYNVGILYHNRTGISDSHLPNFVNSNR
jgi:Rab-like protein 2